MNEVRFRDWVCRVEKGRYSNGRIALSLVDDEGPVATATVNLVDDLSGPNTVFIKDHSENAGLLAALEAAGVVKATGRTVRSGFVDVPVCELQPPYRDMHVEKLVDRGTRQGR